MGKNFLFYAWRTPSDDEMRIKYSNSLKQYNKRREMPIYANAMSLTFFFPQDKGQLVLLHI